jgi:hypothetical protein
MEWLLVDKDVWSAKLEYRLQKDIAFDPIVGSRSKFSRGCFLGVAMEWPLADEDVWLVELEYRLKSAIAFDPTVRSCKKLYRGFQRLFSLGELWNGYSMMRMSGRPNLSIGLKGPYLLIRPL